MNDQAIDTGFSKGLVLISTSVIFWSVLPLALKVTLQSMDGITLTWFRLLFAGLATFGIQYYAGSLNQFRSLSRREWMILLATALLLVANYVVYAISLNYISASESLVFFQLAPFFLSMGGILFFQEKINRWQTMFLLFLFLGLMLFFNDSVIAAANNKDAIWLGALLVVAATMLWSAYALLQKKLSAKISPSNILLFIYATGSVVLFPGAELKVFGTLDPVTWSVLVFCALNSLIAYGAFAEGMRYWNATQAGVALACEPLLAIAATSVAAFFWPAQFVPDPITALGWVGVFLVVSSVVGFNLVQKMGAKKFLPQLFAQWREKRRSVSVMRALLLFSLLSVGCAVPRTRPANVLDRVLQTKILRVGTTGDYKPFSFLDPATQKFEGVDIDLARDLAKTLDAQVVFVQTSWPTLMEDHRQGRFDIAMSGITKKLFRQRDAFFSIGYEAGGKTPIAKCTAKERFSSLERIDQAGTIVVVNPGGTNERFVRSRIKRAAIVLHADNQTIFDQIVAGKADVMITDSIEVRLQQNLKPALCATMPGQTFTKSEIGALLPRDIVWKEYVNAWLEQIKLTGRLETVFEQHLH